MYGVSVIIISLCKSGHIFFLCPLSPFSCPKQRHSFQPPHMRLYACGQCFVLRCSHFGRLLHLKGYISFLLSLCITLSHAFCSTWQTTWNVCRLCVFPCVCVCMCDNTQRSSRKGGQGPLSQQRWRGGIASFLQWGNMTWGPPANSHRITCDRGEPPPHKSPPLLLFFLPLSLLIMPWPPYEIKINYIPVFAVWLGLYVEYSNSDMNLVPNRLFVPQSVPPFWIFVFKVSTYCISLWFCMKYVKS